MGGRGSFVNVDANDFTFKLGGQTYVSKGMIDNVKVIEKIGGSSIPVSAPFLSHSPNRIYATIKNGELKHLTFYDENHRQTKSIDFDHMHDKMQPHVHYNGQHGPNSKSDPPTISDQVIINKIKSRMRLK